MSKDKRLVCCACMMERLEPRLLLDGAVIPGAAELQVGGLLASPAVNIYGPSEAVAVAGGVTKTLPVPEFFWYRGCGPTSVAMVLAYWDNSAYPDYFSGSAETLTNSVKDGIASAGHDADWWPEPDRPTPPDYHTDDCIADYFKTSRGSLKRGWSWGDWADDAFNGYSAQVGYPAADAYSLGYGGFDGGLALWVTLQSEIDAGRPAMFLVDTDGNDSTDHFVPVIGYRTEPRRQYAVFTTWDYDPGIHWFNWNPVSSRLWGISFGTFFRPCSGSPDLAGTHADIVEYTSMIWGDSFTYEFGVKNYGTNNAGGFDIKYYMSNDTDIGAGDYYLGTTHVTSLAAGVSEYGSQGLSLPSSPPAGFTWDDDVWIGMIIDTGGDVAEGVESNNRNLGLHKDYDRLRVDGKPDLVGTAFSLDYGIMNSRRGGTMATFTVTNAGKGSTVNSFNVAFYLSKNTSVSMSDIYLSMRTVSALDSGESYTSAISLIPGRTDPFSGDGTYTIGMVIDYDGRIAEANESNNENSGFGLDKAEANYGQKIFFADFERGDGAMNIVNDTTLAPTDGLWHVELHRAFDAGHSETHSMYYGREDPVNGDYDYDVGDSAGMFYTKYIEMPDEPALLSFNYLSETSSLSDYDKMFVQVHDLETDTYTTVLDKASGLNYDTAGVWKWVEVDLTSFRGKQIQLRFAFDTVSSFGNNREGWYVDDITIWAVANPVTVEAFRSLARDSDYYHEPSYIHWAGDHDTFVFNEEQWDGSFTITTDRHGSPVNPAIAVYDYETREMLYMDSGSGSGDDAYVLLPNSGNWNSYLVEVWDTEENSIGELDVHIDGSGSSGFGNVALDDAGDVSVTGTINSANDTDYFRMVAPAQASGTLDIYLTETSGDLRTQLQVWKGDDESPVAALFADNGAEEATFTGVQPGDEFWVSVSDHTFGSTGDFQLDVDFSTAVPGSLTTAEGFATFSRDGTADDSLSFGAYMNSAGDVDSYYFAGDTGWTGTYTITANPLSGMVDPVVAVYNAATGDQLAFDDNSGTGAGASVSLSLNALTRYIVAVADATGTHTGDVEIIISIADSSTTTAIAVDPSGVGIATGQQLHIPVDTDFYRVTAPPDAYGDLTVRVTPTTGTLDTAVAVFDASGNLLGQAFSAGTGAEDVLALTGLSPGVNYYLSVLSKNYQTSGFFDVEVDFGAILPTTIDTGTDVDFAWGRVNQFGDQTGLHPFYAGNPSIMAIRPESTGPIVLTMSCATVDDVLLGLYNAAGDRVAFDVGLDQTAATINYAGTGAAVYYIYSSSYDGSQSGNYDLDINVPNFSFTADININAITGVGSYAAGYISPKSDQDFFRVVAPVNAAGMTVTMAPDSGSTLKPYVRLYDTSGLRLGADDAASGAAQFTYANVTAGATYVIGTGGNWYTSGAFDLDVTFDLYDVPLTVPTLEYYGPVNLQGDREITEVHINYTSDYDSWRFASRSGGTGIFTATAAAGINPLLALYDGSGSLVAVGENSTGTTETLSYSLNVHEVYTILVQDAERDAIGNVDMSINAPAPSAKVVALDAAGKGSYSGTINGGTVATQAEPDYYKFTAPADALGSMVLAVDPQAAYRLEMQLFDSAGATVGTRYASAAAGSPVTHTYTSLAPGEMYSVCIFAYRFEDHVDPAPYTVDVDFYLVLQVVYSSMVGGEIIPPTGLTYTARFNEQVIMDASDFKLSGAVFGGQAPDSWSYTPANSELIITYGALPADHYTLSLSDSITAAAGSPLDGDGNGLPGGSFLRQMLIAFAGDANLDGRVDAVDYITLKRNIGTASGAGWAQADFTADGAVDVADLQALTPNFGLSIPAAPAVAQALPAAIVADTPDADVLAIAASVLGDRVGAGRHDVWPPAPRPGELLPPVYAARQVGPAAIPSSPLLSPDMSGRVVADILILARTWRPNGSAKRELPDKVGGTLSADSDLWAAMLPQLFAEACSLDARGSTVVLLY